MEIFTMNLAPESKLILLFLQQKPKANIEDLAAILGKSIRTAYRHIVGLNKMVTKSGQYYSLSNLSPVVVDLVDLKDQDKTTTTDLSSSSLEWHDTIGKLLAKYDKGYLINEVSRRITEPNPLALEWLIKDCQKNYKTTFYKYFMWSITNRWNQAVIESREIQEAQPVVDYIIPEEKIERPQANPEASEMWNNKLLELNISEFNKNMWFKTAIPIGFNGKNLIISVENPLSIEKIKEKVSNIEFILEKAQSNG